MERGPAGEVNFKSITRNGAFLIVYPLLKAKEERE
jgi:hypothetical protein